MLPQHDLTVCQRASCDVTSRFSVCKRPPLPHKCSTRVEVRWLWSKGHADQDFLTFFGLQVVLAKLWGVLWVINQPKYESVSANMQTAGCNTLLKNGMLHLFCQDGNNSVQVPDSRAAKTPSDLNIPTCDEVAFLSLEELNMTYWWCRHFWSTWLYSWYSWSSFREGF